MLVALLLSVLFALKFEAPTGWEAVPQGVMSMKLAEYKLPRADGDSEDATVALYNFGSRMGGSVDANIERWLGQFDPKDGEPRIERPKAEDSLKITWVDVSGTYVAETRPGSGTRLNKPGWRMLAAVIEDGDGFYFVKAVGPRATVEKNAEAIRKYGRSASRS